MNANSCNTPSALLRRSGLPPQKRLRQGFEARLDGLVGRWQGRARRVRKLLLAAESVQRAESAFVVLSDRQLQLRLEELRGAWPVDNRKLGAQQLEISLAAVSVAAQRTLEQQPYREQLMGALALTQSSLVEMATGEGKTLTLALAAVLAAWRQRPCHILTANDYLAGRDALGMQGLYRFCGVSVAHVGGGMDDAARSKHYAADVVYTTSRELVADFLRDRLRAGGINEGSRRLLQSLLNGMRKDSAGEGVLRGLHTVFADEADHLLIDEAVTPLIISSPRRDRVMDNTCAEAFARASALVPGVDYEVDLRAREVRLNPHIEEQVRDQWQPRTPILRGLRWRREWLIQALRAREFFKRGRQYGVVENKVVIIDEGTGRYMPMRSWRQGIHQFVELKEGVALSPSSMTVASISFQRFFRHIPHLAGVTGTARENAGEFWRIYRLPLMVAPTHRPCRRRMSAVVFDVSGEVRWRRVADKIAALHAEGRPVLAGTRSIEASMELSRELALRELPHQLLNADEHAKEAKVIAHAGLPGTITVATNMAGRGADIRLGAGVAAAGGLVVIATELHESARVDRQLYGRCARQGEPGEVLRFASLEDELFCRYLPGWLQALCRRALQYEIYGAAVLCRLSFRAAQLRAGGKALKSRLQVLRHDKWLDDSFGAS